MDSEDPTAEDVERATNLCVKWLAQRGRSRHELHAALERKGFTEPVCERALARVAELGYLDDTRFARNQAELLLGRGRHGPRAVEERLLAHGLSPEAVSDAVASVSGELGFDPERAARQVLAQRGFAERVLPPKERARAARLLFSRGFSEELIHRLLGDATLEPSGPDD
ncbi:regulatory protein RecX [Archangium primigenium]|uniref:regulatory protein RecX n=1 Tax=[Archangium] primigenium TaxID=2792470 RepID=UPI001958785C|nr:regulatory protein RecX [Archangium primigenium]MBM7114685.1 regulatory protein RecX [Archangium primigenium]